MLSVWLPWMPDPHLFDGLDPRLKAAVFAEGAAGSDFAREVELFVAPWWLRAEVEKALPRMSALRVLQTLTAGVDSLLPIVPPGVTLCDGSGIHDAAVSEWIVGAILAMQRRLPECVDEQRAGRWGRVRGDDLAGRTVLIVGHGSIGRALEARLAPFEVKFLRVARRARDGVHAVPDLPGLLPQADVVVLLVPLTKETRGLMGAANLGLMKEGALLVNASRGAVVDGEALLVALTAGRIRAALDVTDPEPLPEGHPLWHAPHVLITPHVAGTTPLFRARAERFMRRQIGHALEGEPLENVVREGY